MRHFLGQSLSENGVIMAFIVLIAIPALLLLGDSVKLALQDSAQGSPTVKSDVVSSSKVSLLNASEKAQPFQGAYNPETGEITFTLPESSRGGAIATSSEGAAKTFSDALARLANTWTDADGKPLDDSLKSEIMNLANTGYDLALKQGPPAPGKENDLLWRSDDFADDYNNVAAKIDALSLQHPEYAALKSTISGYAGTISYVNYNHFLDPTSVSNNNNTAVDFLVGTKPANIDALKQQDSANVIHASSAGIEATANK